MQPRYRRSDNPHQERLILQRNCNVQQQQYWRRDLQYRDFYGWRSFNHKVYTQQTTFDYLLRNNGNSLQDINLSLANNGIVCSDFNAYDYQHASKNTRGRNLAETLPEINGHIANNGRRNRINHQNRPVPDVTFRHKDMANNIQDSMLYSIEDFSINFS